MRAKVLIYSLLASSTLLAGEPDKTTFQTAGQWKPLTDVRADAAIVYGINGNRRHNFEERVKSWRDRGYTVHFMTGVAWGEYQDYFLGKWDGDTTHLKREGQFEANGRDISHGHYIPYIVPSDSFIKYMCETQIKRVIDAGITRIYLEEPEFWMRGGFSEGFKDAWQSYYGYPWRDQRESPANTYLSNKLKYHLYYDALNRIFTYAKEYGRSKGVEVECFVPTHSLLNYTTWQIVSPEASLASLDCVDGYIAQVWTGTSREPNYYNGEVRERVFETALLEYACMKSMTEPTGRRMYFLTDPIEDRVHDWGDYKRNYQATFAAKLMLPDVEDYEVMPWPDRIYEGLYPKADGSGKERIPRDYSTLMQIMVNSLNDIRRSDNRLSGTQGISVLMANSMMFQRFPEHSSYDDPRFSSFFGQTLPLLKRGIPVDIAHIENLAFPASLGNTKVLVMSYSNMKPLDPVQNEQIAEWVKRGGQLIYCGEDIDPYQAVPEWWNTGDRSYNAPSEHLFELMSIANPAADGLYKYGKGAVRIMRRDPKHFVMTAGADRNFYAEVESAYRRATGKVPEQKNNFTLRRDPYVISAALTESVSDEPLVLDGLFIDLFDKDLPVLERKVVEPGSQSYLLDLSKVKDRKRPQVLCGASRVYDETVNGNSYSFTAKSPAETVNVSRVLLPKSPKEVRINGELHRECDWDAKSKTLLVPFENDPDGVKIEIRW